MRWPQWRWQNPWWHRRHRGVRSERETLKIHRWVAGHPGPAAAHRHSRLWAHHQKAGFFLGRLVVPVDRQIRRAGRAGALLFHQPPLLWADRCPHHIAPGQLRLAVAALRHLLALAERCCPLDATRFPLSAKQTLFRLGGALLPGLSRLLYAVHRHQLRALLSGVLLPALLLGAIGACPT